MSEATRRYQPMTVEEREARRKLADQRVAAAREGVSFNWVNFSPLEHELRGSTPWTGEKAITLDEAAALKVASRNGDEDARRRLLTPLAIQEQGLTNPLVKLINKNRAAERENREVGVLWIFNPRSYAKLNQSGYTVYCEPPAVQNTGEIKPEMRLFLLDNDKKVISDSTVWNDVVIDDMEKPWYSISEVPNKEYRLLIAHVTPQKGI